MATHRSRQQPGGLASSSADWCTRVLAHDWPALIRVPAEGGPSALSSRATPIRARPAHLSAQRGSAAGTSGSSEGHHKVRPERASRGQLGLKLALPVLQDEVLPVAVLGWLAGRWRRIGASHHGKPLAASQHPGRAATPCSPWTQSPRGDVLVHAEQLQASAGDLLRPGQRVDVHAQEAALGVSVEGDGAHNPAPPRLARPLAPAGSPPRVSSSTASRHLNGRSTQHRAVVGLDALLVQQTRRARVVLVSCTRIPLPGGRRASYLLEAGHLSIGHDTTIGPSGSGSPGVRCGRCG